MSWIAGSPTTNRATGPTVTATFSATDTSKPPGTTIVATVRSKFAGEIVATEFEGKGGRPYYEFHLLAEDGRLTEVKVDARNGRILGREPDDD